MDETTRLRKLDAAFAEKVLGATIQASHRAMTCYDDGPPMVTGVCSTGEFGCSYGAIPRYTRSLALAYDGAVRLGWIRLEGPALRKRETVYDCRFEPNDAAKLHDAIYRATHPAEAIVVACLRATGATEA
jgi:hypothetical protein